MGLHTAPTPTLGRVKRCNEASAGGRQPGGREGHGRGEKSDESPTSDRKNEKDDDQKLRSLQDRNASFCP